MLQYFFTVVVKRYTCLNHNLPYLQSVVCIKRFLFDDLSLLLYIILHKPKFGVFIVLGVILLVALVESP